MRANWGNEDGRDLRVDKGASSGEGVGGRAGGSGDGQAISLDRREVVFIACHQRGRNLTHQRALGARHKGLVHGPRRDH
jgi:hypothetical protein